MPKSLPFLKRASLTRHLVAQKLFKIMEDKQSNLAVAIDTTSPEQLLELADKLGPELCVVKTHVDILDHFTPDIVKTLRTLADKHRFLIFEDRKFADIGHTVSHQFRGGIYQISEWADLINAHGVPGPGLIAALKGSGLLLIAEMSSQGTLATGSYTRKIVEMGDAHKDCVMGYISLRKLSKDPGMIHFTPGVKWEEGQDSLGQRYRTLDEILIKNKSDVIIVGRDITHAADPKHQAALYREKAWNAHVKAC